MNIDKTNFNNIQSIYKYNTYKQNQIDKSKMDRVEISELGKYLNQVNNDDTEINFEKVNEIKKKIENGTYKVNSRDLAEKIIEHLKGEK